MIHSDLTIVSVEHHPSTCIMVKTVTDIVTTHLQYSLYSLHKIIRQLVTPTPPPPKKNNAASSDCARNRHCSSLYKGMKSTSYFELVHTNIDKRQT